MKLSLANLNETVFWQQKGYQLPQFDVVAMREKTRHEPQWLHFGGGNIFRAFLANLQQTLLNEGLTDTGITTVTGHNRETLEKVYHPYDDLSIFVRLKNDRSMDKIIIGSIGEALCNEDFGRLNAIVAQPSLQMMSFTVTEKSYQLKEVNGNYQPAVQADFEQSVAQAQSFIGKLVAMLYGRFQNGAMPIALVSMDNMAHNGDVLKQAVLTFAQVWAKNGAVSPEFVAWLQSESVAFPWSMIDKITPRPDESVAKMLTEDGLEAMNPIVTSRQSYVAPFVNAEELEYLVIEDHFPNGKPPLEKAGVIFTDRETVNKVETMKVTTCLNPIHTALAIFGCLFGYTSIHREMQDPDLQKLCQAVGYVEGLPVVVDPNIINPKQFIDEVVNKRFPNPFIPDTPQRIATDTSQKLRVRFGETIKAYQNSGALHPEDLVALPLVFAGWCRYLLGIDDQGNTFTCSPDPLLKEVQAKLAGVHLGNDNIGEVSALFADNQIFGVNLYAVGLGEKTENYLREMLAGHGAVRNTLQKNLAGIVS